MNIGLPVNPPSIFGGEAFNISQGVGGALRVPAERWAQDQLQG